MEREELLKKMKAIVADKLSIGEDQVTETPRSSRTWAPTPWIRWSWSWPSRTNSAWTSPTRTPRS